MADSFTYVFNGPSGQDSITVQVSSPPTDSTGYGTSYAVTGVSGTIDGMAITGVSGTPGAVQTDSNGKVFNNAIFVSPEGGFARRSVNGIDHGGIEFTVGGTTYNLETTNGAFELVTIAPKYNNQPLTLVSTNAPCYCPGTLILTERGEVPVEQLQAGDVLVTAAGALQPVRWIGRRAYAGRFLAANPAVKPIRFRAGSLGDGLPRRDLLVSPDHAMFLDGVLVPARLLVNGTTVVQEAGLEKVEYVHVELERHDVIVAEGAPSESYLDDGSRRLFSNASECETPESDDGEPGSFCAPRIEDGPVLAAIQHRLNAAPLALAA